MPRSGPIYTLPEAAFVPNTVISSAAVNDDFSDIAAALTDSLARNGAGGMTAVLPLANAGFSYLSDPNTGMSRSAADTQVITCGGENILTASPHVIAVAGIMDAATVTQNGSPLTMIGEVRMWSGTTAPTEWVFCDGSSHLRTALPRLWTFAAAQIALGNLLFTNGNGSTTFTVPDLRGRVPVHPDGGAGRLTSTTMAPNGTTLGSVGGAQTHQITAQENGPHLHPVFAGVETHPHTVSALGLVSVQNGTGTPQGNLLTTSGGTPTNIGVVANLTGLTVRDTAGGGGTANQTAASGSGDPHINVQPTIVIPCIIYAGA